MAVKGMDICVIVRIIFERNIMNDRTVIFSFPITREPALKHRNRTSQHPQSS